jgi:hypothetical protein
MKEQTPHTARIPLWPLPFAAALTVCVGAIGAAWLSMHLGLTPACNPLIEGCVSISRAGRHGLANIFFQGLVLPSAVLQAITWWLCGQWLAQRPCSPAPWFARLGVVAGIFLCLYASFLGTEGDMYRWLRQYGTIFYFGFTYLCMLMMLGRLRHMQDVPGVFAPVLQSLCIALLLLGLANTLLAQLFEDPFKDRMENITEWWLGLGFVLVFVLIAETWRRMRVSLTWTT